MRARIQLGIAALLGACGQVGVGNDANAADPATAPAAAVVPKPGELRTFTDWTVGCDNRLTCTAASLAPEGGEFPAVTMSITRAGGPAGATVVAFQSSEAIPLPLIVAVDGKLVGSGGRTDDDATRIDGDLAARILAAVVAGRKLTVSDGQKLATSEISLAGLSASWRWADERQGRVGTASAAVAKGAKPADSVPAAPTAPTIVALAPGGTAAQPTAAQIADMNKLADCQLDPGAMDGTPELAALGGGATLVMLPCSAGAYNLSSALFVLRDGKVAPAAVDAPSGFGEDGGAEAGPPQIVNGSFENGLLTSYAKGRGIGDCGVSQDFAWDGTRFRLVAQGEMGECRGNTELIRTWTASVARK